MKNGIKMDLSKKTKSFLTDWGVCADQIDIDATCKSILSEMEMGLEGGNSSLEMIPTYINFPVKTESQTVVAIDAGGTNLRAAVVTFSESGTCNIESLSKAVMPGSERYLSKNEFFSAIAAFIRPLVSRSDMIGFCFSYPTKIYPDKDGRLIRFAKEIKAPEVEGELIGQNLLDALGIKKKIVILNDTVATLLAGMASKKRTYSSYVGFILGTGMNGSYVESGDNIRKLKGIPENQIINTELGNFSKLERSPLDLELDHHTENPGVNPFEKMTAGGYLGDLVLHTLKKSVEEGLIEGQAALRLGEISTLETKEVNEFLHSPQKGNLLADIFGQSEEGKICNAIAANLVERASKLAAASLSALSIKSGEGRSPDQPVCLTVEGSTFYRLKGLRDLTLFHLQQYLTEKRRIHFDLIEVENATIKGAAIAGLS